MRALEEKIIKEGSILPGNVLKVGNFLNQQMDVAFIMEMGEEIARLFRDSGATRILTVETSGIAIAFAAAVAMNLPLVFAKKHASANMSGDTYTASVASFTHNKIYEIAVSAEYVPEGEKVLLVDDFLAVGNALRGLISICGQAKAEVVGIAVAIEKQFQGGGDGLRALGYRVESLAKISELDVSRGITFCD